MESARDYLARVIRERAEARFDLVNSRADLRAVANLDALAGYIESESETGGLFGFLTPSKGSRPFPSEGFWQVVEEWADEPTCELATLARCLVRVELEAALEAELPALA